MANKKKIKTQKKVSLSSKVSKKNRIVQNTEKRPKR